MDKFFSGYKRKANNNGNTNADTSRNRSKKEQGGKAPRKRQYSSSYISLRFTSIIVEGLEKIFNIMDSIF
jgi:hypothetical protein